MLVAMSHENSCAWKTTGRSGIVRGSQVRTYGAVGEMSDVYHDITGSDFCACLYVSLEAAKSNKQK